MCWRSFETMEGNTKDDTKSLCVRNEIWFVYCEPSIWNARGALHSGEPMAFYRLASLRMGWSLVSFRPSGESDATHSSCLVKLTSQRLTPMRYL